MYSLSKPQEAIYYMSRYAENSIANIAGDVFYDFPVSIEEIHEAMISFLDKCEIMHTRIHHINGEPMQSIEKDPSYADIEIKTFANYNEYEKWANQEAIIPIQISDRLYRLYIIDINGKIGLFSVVHHLISDASSFAYIGKYVGRFLKGEKDITIYSYKEYLNAENEYKLTKRYEKDRGYWLNEYKNNTVNYFSKKETSNQSAARRSLKINQKLSHEIFLFCEKNNISEFVFFLSLIATLYYRTTMNNSFFIGTPVLNRYSNQEDNMLGVFVNTVPIGFSINETDTFNDICLRTADQVLSAFRHQKYHYTQLLKDISNEGYPSRRLFDVLLSFWNVKILKDSTADWFCNCNQTESLQIHIDDRKNDGFFSINYDYQTEKFSECDIDVLHEHICTLLHDAVNNENKSVAKLKILSSEEKQNFLSKFNDTFFEYSIPVGSTLYSLFEETTKKNANKVCIKADGNEITFGEFLNIAEQLDTEIRTYTKGEKRVVGVIADRSIEMYAAIYGIIRGGNAYMPISPDYPQDRIEYMLKNSNSPLCIAQGKYCSLAGENHINMTDFIKNLPKKDVVPFACEEDDTAYVIYTSGSTGKPKGAKVSHKSAVNRILWMHDKYPLEKDGVILQKTPYTFDVSVWEIFWWGITGGALCASKPDEHFLPSKILEETQKNKVTHLHFVPSVFDLFLTYLENNKEEQRKFDSVKYVFLSGEALTANHINRFYSIFDYEKVTLHNLYGPTECAVDVTYYDCAPCEADPVPIGKPIYNTSMYVVDKFMKPVPIGVTGELCIGGINVGQGYLNNPELTAEKFIDNPFGEGKLYKTGDLAYWREDGEIIFCGRMDNQVKLNGQRIELGEIESVIASVPGIDGAAVAVRKFEDRDILVAFCCGNESCKNAVKEFCSQQLPSYMVPKAFVFLDEMPLNQSGKLDRKYLSTLNFQTEADAIEKPLNETERRICDAFCKVLNIEAVGRNSNFFDLGGTSISMISVLSDGVLESVTAPDFIANSTPAKLAQLLEHNNKPIFNYIQKLSEPNASTKAFILFPYAGGGAEVYTSFVKDFEKQSKNFALFFVDYLHTKEECEKVAFEISQLAKAKDIYFYSHCAGSAVAMQVLNIIEANELCSIKHYIAGGSIPLEKPSAKNTWNYVPNFILKRILVNAGASLKGMDKHTVTDTLRRFRKDTDFMTAYFHSKSTTKVKCPLSLVMSKQDVFTKEYKKAQELWAPYAENLSNIRFIETTSHYFQATNSYELVNIILDYIK